MRTYAHFCQLCFGEGSLRLARGRYWTPDGPLAGWDVCEKHLKEVKGHGFDTEKFEYLGNVDMADVDY